jgi:hypothetical protein
VIAHIEASFSGFGTSDTKEEGPSQESALKPAFSSEGNTALAGRLVSLAEAPRPPGDRQSAKSKLTGPYAVAALVGVTVLALTASLAWIVHGQRPISTVSSNEASKPALAIPLQAKVASPIRPEPARVDPPLPVPETGRSGGDDNPPKFAPDEDRAAKDKVLKATERSAAARKRQLAKEVSAKKQKPAVVAKKEQKRRLAKTTLDELTPTIPAGYPMPQALRSDGGSTTPTVKPVIHHDSGASGPAGKQTAHSDIKPREQKGNVEALCSDRSNFFSRSFCHNQYCAEPQRKNDPTCQRLRQYEMARQNSTY